jgi:hypothetical protein
MRPTIKGIFVLSHIRALEKERGKKALAELRKRYGKSLNFRPADNVPIDDEYEILGHIIDMTSAKKLTDEERAFEAGKLHLKNFATTPMWLILDPMIRHNPKWVLLQSKYIAELIFENVSFESHDLNQNAVQLVLHNAQGYPLEHFQGFLYELMAAARLTGAVESGVDHGAYVYTISWR